jgi:hypothetical protein
MAWSSASDTCSHWKSSHGSGSDSCFEATNDESLSIRLSSLRLPERMASGEVNSEMPRYQNAKHEGAWELQQREQPSKDSGVRREMSTTIF